MNYSNLNWQLSNSDLNICLPIILTLIFFSLYWFVSKSEKIKKKFYDKSNFDEASLKHIFFTKYFGLISMGILPTILLLFFIPSMSLEKLGFTIKYDTSLFSFLWTLGLSILIVPLVYFSAKNPKNLINYPQIRSKIWTRKTMFLNALGWFLYDYSRVLIFKSKAISIASSTTTKPKTFFGGSRLKSLNFKLKHPDAFSIFPCSVFNQML
mgnify:CR=1 FL=1